MDKRFEGWSEAYAEWLKISLVSVPESAIAWKAALAWASEQIRDESGGRIPCRQISDPSIAANTVMFFDDSGNLVGKIENLE